MLSFCRWVLLDEVHNTKLSAHFWVLKDACFVICSCVVATGEKTLFREFGSNVRFVNMLKIAQKHPQAYWNLYPFLTDGLDLGLWTLSLGCKWL